MSKTFHTKPFYADFATRAFRFYVRNPDPPEKGCSEADAKNWTICDEIYREADDGKRRIIDAIFGFRLPMISAVSYAATLTGKPENEIWRVLRCLQKDFADKRGLR